MPALPSDLRRQLENVIIQARDVAETAARAALKRLAVDAARPFDHFSEAQRQWRNRLRARARQAGDQRQPNGEQEIEQLTQELAYEYWHRMLFARFLAENNLLMHPDGVAVSLADCQELAQIEGTENGWIMAARYASRMLPQIFRTDDVLLEIEFPINDRLPLEKLLANLLTETFTADDSLGWVYQFWQSNKKEEVNRSAAKIDGHTLPAVTQLFTEPYMVKFLLQNTIGAWWCAQHRITGPSGGAGVPTGQVPVEMDYIRWRDDGTPAAGSFDGWPKTLKDFSMLDPCCGSGHFLVEALHLLVPLRMHDEGLSARRACNAVLSENLFGLELDPRCTQIAAFALALTAWKYPDETSEPLGYRPLPILNIACSGQSVTGKKEEWLALANGDSRLLEGTDKLYDLFRQAPHLGSLIDPRREVGDLIVAGYAELRPLLEQALTKEMIRQDVDAAAISVAAQGIAKAAELLAKEYTLIATNVPYLVRNKQGEVLRSFIASQYPNSILDLATAFLERCRAFCEYGGSYATVTPQNWLFLTSYRRLREKLLQEQSWNHLTKNGSGATAKESWEVLRTLSIISNYERVAPNLLTGLEAAFPTEEEKAVWLKQGLLLYSDQDAQLKNPDARIALQEAEHSISLLQDYADGIAGLQSGDYPRYGRYFWEMPRVRSPWIFQQSPVPETVEFGGLEHILWWEDGRGALVKSPGARVQGLEAWGKFGIAVTQMRKLPTSLYTGAAWDNNVAVILPHDPSHLPAIWAFCQSPKFNEAVRRIDQKINVTNATVVKVPFDLSYWQEVASEQYPNRLPKPHADDPTQWLFSGHPKGSRQPLHVTVGRLLGYRWPRHTGFKLPECPGLGPDGLEGFADEDGIVCISAVRRERPATERLLEVLRAAYGSQWSDAILNKLLADAGCRPDMPLDDWLRDKFFEQHCKYFYHRPFIWHIWDGRKDGFSCLVNYHKLDHQRLETLTYAYLQDWITAQTMAAKDSKPGADLRLAAAQELQNKLKLILDGEPPYDIFVRWKPIHEQPIGWNPDLNDGVRVNIRPFVMANVLRKPPNIKWTEDRGKEPERDPEQFPWFWDAGAFTGNRINDVHLTNAQKRPVREKAGQGSGGS
jgi:hypothetical protein